MTIFNRKLLRINQARIINNFADYNFIYHEIISRIKENISLISNRNFNSILKLGILDDYQLDINTDLIINTSLFKNKFCHIICDDQHLAFKANSFDLIISNLNLQFINDIDEFIKQIYYLLKKDGIFIASFFGEENLKELNHAMQISENEIYGGVSPRLPPTIDVKSAAMLLQKYGFKNSTSTHEKLSVSYKNVTSLLKDIKYMSLSNIMNKKTNKFFTKTLLKKVIANYHHLYENNNQINATFEVIIMIGTKI